MNTTTSRTELDAQAYAAWTAADQNVTHAAKALGAPRKTVADRIARHRAYLAGQVLAAAVVTPAPEPEPEPETETTGFPEGVVSPYKFRDVLVERGIAPDTLRPQRVYGWVKGAGKKGKNGNFPVATYNGRPGVNVAQGITWYQAR